MSYKYLVKTLGRRLLVGVNTYDQLERNIEEKGDKYDRLAYIELMGQGSPYHMELFREDYEKRRKKIKDKNCNPKDRNINL